MLHFIELPFQLVDQIVDGDIHIIVFSAGDKLPVRRADGRIGGKTLWLFREDDMGINQLSLPFIQFGETVGDMLADCRSDLHLFAGNVHCHKFYLLSFPSW